MKYDEWRTEVIRLMIEQGHLKNENHLGPDFLRDSWEAGMNPQEAIDLDMSYL